MLAAIREGSGSTRSALGDRLGWSRMTVSKTVWVIAGDGCMQEGVSAEASSLAGTLSLESAEPPQSRLDVPEVPEFLEQIVASGGHLWACRLSADMNKLKRKDLYDEVEGIISATDFIEITEGAQVIFI